MSTSTPPPPPAEGTPPRPGFAPDGREYAPWIWRVLSFLIDQAPLLVLSIIFASVSSFAAESGGPSSIISAITFILWIVSVVYWFWNKGYREGKTGKSIGKQLTGYTTVKETTGEPLGVGLGCLRALLLMVDFWICYIGVLWPLWDAKRQCLISDKATGAVVYKD